MIRLLTVLCLLCEAPFIFGLWGKSLKVRFDVNPFGIGTTSFIELPQSVSEANVKKWKEVKGPQGPPGYSSLTLMCPKKDYGVCVLFDDTGYIAGLQMSFDKSRLSTKFSTDIQGYSEWTTTINGEQRTYKTMRQYYISTETLATDAASRIASRDPEKLLQDSNIYVTGFNSQLFNISTNVKDFTKDKDSIYKKQACIPGMGTHYYYNLTTNTICEANSMFPWFPLVDSNQLIGVGFFSFGHYTLGKGERNYFENPGRLAAQLIIPRASECVYDLASNPGLVTMHTYFIKEPYLVTCLF